jgi:hypothetical protein
VFAAAGDVAPDLWLFTARAGALAGVVFAFRVARRLGGTPAGIVAAVAYAPLPGPCATPRWATRRACWSPWPWRRSIATPRARARGLRARPRRRAPAPEPGRCWSSTPPGWPGGTPGARLLVAAGLAAIPICWFLPELWGSATPCGRCTAPATRARQPGVRRRSGRRGPAPVLGDAHGAAVGGRRRAPGRRAGRRAPTRAELRLAVALLAAPPSGWPRSRS